MIVHLIDGTYELFRQFYGRRHFSKGKDEPFGAVSGVLHSILEMIETGATHVGVATDHVIESFRNDLWPDYKTGEGIEPALLAQFHPLEEALTAMGVVVWPMIELEADDALASAAQIASGDERVEKVCIWTPDKDLAQCVRGDRVVQVDRKGKTIRNAAGVREKFGVEPELIPDFLALVGDTADGYPGIAGIGAVTAARLLNQYGAIETFPLRCSGSSATGHCCSKPWPRSGSMRHSSTMWTSSGGAGPPVPSPSGRSAWETPDYWNAAARCDSASNIPRRLDVQSESILTSLKRLDSVGSQSTRCGGRYDLRVQWIEASLGASKRQARGGNANCRGARGPPDGRQISTPADRVRGLRSRARRRAQAESRLRSPS